MVCRQLRCGAALRATTDAHFGGGTGPIWLHRVNCSGHERSLSDCDLNRYLPYCGHSGGAGVLCSGERCLVVMVSDTVNDGEQSEMMLWLFIMSCTTNTINMLVCLCTQTHIIVMARTLAPGALSWDAV